VNSASKFRIFSCDGGGFRGYLTSLILEQIEEELNQVLGSNEPNSNHKLGNYFDMYAGTSTGSLIACGLSFGLSAREIADIYRESGKDIFPNINIGKEISYRFAQIFSAFTPKSLEGMTSQHRFWFSGPLLRGDALKNAICSKFGNATFGEISKDNKRILVTAYDCWNSLPVVFDSHNKQHREIKVVDILLASSAYPGGFASHANIPAEQIYGGKTKEPGYSIPSDRKLPLVDGGLIANNPGLLALTEYCQTRTASSPPVVLASFGTGKLILKFDSKDSGKMGQLDWTFPFGDPLLEVVYGGYSRLIDRIASSLMKTFINHDDGSSFFRFQPYVLTKEEGERRFVSPDAVFVCPQERKIFETATFQYKARGVLETIARRYLEGQKEYDSSAADYSDNLELQVSQRIEKLVKTLVYC
jgi:predicted acylesterase/phospholipase RssA